MPLSLKHIRVGAVVDWNLKWEGSVETHRNPIRRGMIVRVDGDPQQETVNGIYATFGDDIGKDRFEFNGITMPCVKVAARELTLVWGFEERRAQEAWKRVFNVPDGVGSVFQNKAAKGGKPKTLDKLQLTGVAPQGPIVDGPSPLVVADKDE